MTAALISPPGHAPMLNRLSSPIDFDGLQQAPVHTWEVFAGVEGQSQFVLHSYIEHFDGRFWIMWSQHPTTEDEKGQRIYYATSETGRIWSQPQPLSPPPAPNWRHIARGFWFRDGELIGLYSNDQAVRPLFGPGLELMAVTWDGGGWGEAFQVRADTINNFPPVRLPDGTWSMAVRDHDRVVSFIKGDLGDWSHYPVDNPEGLVLSEPTLVMNGGVLKGLFRCDNGEENNRIGRAFSFDLGATWTTPRLTNFPDARSKNHCIRLSTGIYVLASNPVYLRRRSRLMLALSADGYRFDRLLMLRGEPTEAQWSDSPVRVGYQYPHMMERAGYLWCVYSKNKESIEVSRVAISALTLD